MQFYYSLRLYFLKISFFIISIICTTLCCTVNKKLEHNISGGNVNVLCIAIITCLKVMGCDVYL